MTHLLSLFGHDDETRMREKRLINNAVPENNQPTPEQQQIAALQKENQFLRSKLEKMEQAQETTNRLLEMIATKLSAADVPKQSQDGHINVASVQNRGHQHPRAQRMMYQEVADHYRGGFPMPERATQILQRYPSPYAKRRQAPLPSVATLRKFYNHDPTATHFRKTFKSQGNIPDSVHWTEAAVANHVVNSEGTPYKTGANSTYIHKNVREGKEKVSSSQMADYHESRLRKEIFDSPKYEQLRGNPAAEEAFEQYEEMMSRPGVRDRRVQYNHIALLRTRLDTINKMYKAEKEYGEKPFNDSGVIEHIYLGDDRDRRVMITIPKNKYGVSETIKLSPSKRTIFGSTSDAEKMKDWNITYKVKRRNTDGPTHYDAIGISLSFSKPGTYIVDGRTVVVKADAEGNVKNAEQSRRVENALLRTPAIVSKTRSRMTKLYVTKNGSEAYTEIYVDNMEAGEGRDGSNGVTAFRDENGELHLAFFEAGSYQVLGRFIGGQQEGLGTFTVKGKLSPEKKQPRPDPREERENEKPSSRSQEPEKDKIDTWSHEKLQAWVVEQDIDMTKAPERIVESEITIANEQWMLGAVIVNTLTGALLHYIYAKNDPVTLAFLPKNSDEKNASVLELAARHAKARRESEIQNAAGMNEHFDLEKSDMAYISFNDEMDPLTHNVAGTMEGVPQLLAKRYPVKASIQTDLASESNPLNLIQSTIYNQSTKGIKNFYISLVAHGSEDGFHFGKNVISSQELLQVFKEFPECTFNVNAISCNGGGMEEAMKNFRDAENTKDGRIHIYTQTKGDVTNHAYRNISGNKTTPYNALLMKYLAQGVDELGIPGKKLTYGEAHMLADLEAKKLSCLDASAFTSRGSNRMPDHTADNSPSRSENAA